MRQAYSIFSIVLSGLFLIHLSGCNTDASQTGSSEYLQAPPVQYISTGGTYYNEKLCPSSPVDVIVNLPSLNPKPKPGEPEMTMKGIKRFMEEHRITSITELINTFPEHYRTNFSLVEHTKGAGKSSLNFPRIVLFGSDGRFLMNIGTKIEDPKYDLLDCAELDDKTGKWEFSQFDFTSSKPVLHVNPKECLECHGSVEPRPVWGTNMDWPGVFGDNEAIGPNGEALSPRHARRMNEIKTGHGGSDRFAFLKWREERLRSGGFRRIADNVFGAELLVSNLAMGSATARGIFLRMKNKYPERYKALREEILLLGYAQCLDGVLSDTELSQIEATIAQYGGTGNEIDDLFAVLGLDVNESFSLGTLAEKEKPNPIWSLGDGEMYEQIYLQVLDDLAQSDAGVKNILSSSENVVGIFNCNGLAENIQEVVDYKMLYLFHLKGSARHEVNKVYYPIEAERVYDVVLSPIAKPLCNYLKTKIQVSS